MLYMFKVVPNTPYNMVMVFPWFFIHVPPPPLRTTVIVHNRFPQENINVYKSCKNQHDRLIMCCVHSNDKIVDFLYTKIDEK